MPSTSGVCTPSFAMIFLDDLCYHFDVFPRIVLGALDAFRVSNWYQWSAEIYSACMAGSGLVSGLRSGVL